MEILRESLKRILNLKTEEEIKKENLHKQKKIFGKTSKIK